MFSSFPFSIRVAMNFWYIYEWPYWPYHVKYAHTLCVFVVVVVFEFRENISVFSSFCYLSGGTSSVVQLKQDFFFRINLSDFVKELKFTKKSETSCKLQFCPWYFYTATEFPIVAFIMYNGKRIKWMMRADQMCVFFEHL